MNTGWIVEEQVSGIDRWFRSNAWIYESEEKALALAEGRAKQEGITSVRVLEISHTDPKVIKSVGGRNAS